MDINLAVEVLHRAREKAGCVQGKEQLQMVQMLLQTPCIVRVASVVCVLLGSWTSPVLIESCLEQQLQNCCLVA